MAARKRAEKAEKIARNYDLVFVPLQENIAKQQWIKALKKCEG